MNKYCFHISAIILLSSTLVARSAQVEFPKSVKVHFINQASIIPLPQPNGELVAPRDPPDLDQSKPPPNTTLKIAVDFRGVTCSPKVPSV
jgi:hypothetical protein